MIESKYSSEVEHAAFMLWWETCERSPAKVAEVLATDESVRTSCGLYDDAPSPDRSTISRWAKEKFWALNATDKMREAAPWRMQAAAVRMVYAQADAAEYLAGTVTTERALDSSDKIRSDNAKHILSMGMGDSLAARIKPMVDKSLDPSTLSELTTAELEALNADLTHE